MAKRHQVGVQLGVQQGRIGSAVFALRFPANPSLQAHADARICCVGGGVAEVLTQIIGNALLPKVDKAH